MHNPFYGQTHETEQIYDQEEKIRRHLLTRCKEKFQGYQTVVGGFAPAGLGANKETQTRDIFDLIILSQLV